MESLRMIELPHQIYSPDLSPNDFWLYSYIKKKLKGRIHNSPEELLASILEIVENIDKPTWKSVMDLWITRFKLFIRSDDIFYNKAKYQQNSDMVLGAIGISFKSKLIFLDLSVDEIKYRRLFEEYEICKLGRSGCFYFMQDDVPASICKTTRIFL